jgi:hypothetical protein
VCRRRRSRQHAPADTLGSQPFADRPLRGLEPTVSAALVRTDRRVLRPGHRHAADLVKTDREGHLTGGVVRFSQGLWPCPRRDIHRQPPRHTPAARDVAESGRKTGDLILHYAMIGSGGADGRLPSGAQEGTGKVMRHRTAPAVGGPPPQLCHCLTSQPIRRLNAHGLTEDTDRRTEPAPTLRYGPKQAVGTPPTAEPRGIFRGEAGSVHNR